MKVYNHKDAFTHLKYIFQYPQEDAFIAVINETLIHYGEDIGFDVAKVFELNIPRYNLQRKGGAIVASPGDIVYCFYSKHDNAHYNTNLGKFLIKKLKEYNINAEFVDNDLVIDNKKFLGQMYTKINEMSFYGGHISINCNKELIQEVCTKPVKKTPEGLSAYNIKTEDVINWLNEF